jgi:hypothetical protein
VETLRSQYTKGTDITKTVSPFVSPFQFILSFIKWWYVDALFGHFRFAQRSVVLLFDRLSIVILLKTFFVPWHREKSYFGAIFGIIMRLLWIPMALLVILLVIILEIIFILFWLVLPVITVYNLIFFWI